MAKDLLEIEGEIVELLPNAFFKVKIQDTTIIAYANGKIRKNNIRLSLGDIVRLEISTYDLSRGRIVYRI